MRWLLDESDIPNKRRYTSLIRAQLSAYELVFLFYDCLSTYGTKMNVLVRKYDLLEHLDTTLLLQQEDVMVFEDAFRKQEKVV